MELVGALESLCSVHQAKGLKRQIIVANRVKNMNANVLNNADHIHAAIDRDVCIRFRYFDYGVKMERILRKKAHGMWSVRWRWCTATITITWWAMCRKKTW